MATRRETQRRHALRCLTRLGTACKPCEPGEDAAAKGLELFDAEWQNIQAWQACAGDGSVSDVRRNMP